MKTRFTAIFGVIGIVSCVCGVIFTVRNRMAVSIIGGADGPTSIFIAGKIAGKVIDGVFIRNIVVGSGLVALVALLWFIRKK